MGEEEEETELRGLVEQLDQLVPREGAHVGLPVGPGGGITIGNRAGYLRLGIELLVAALRPLPGSEETPPRVAPDVRYLLPPDSRSPFELCELDEAIGRRPPVESALGPLGQLAAGVALVAALLAVLVAVAFALRFVFG
jgi:hypothetical protein